MNHQTEYHGFNPDLVILEKELFFHNQGLAVLDISPQNMCFYVNISLLVIIRVILFLDNWYVDRYVCDIYIFIALMNIKPTKA